MANLQVQGIHLTACIDNQVHNLNESLKGIVCHIHRIRVVCSNFQCSSFLHKTRIHLILRLALELAASLQVSVLVFESKETGCLVSMTDRYQIWSNT